MIIGSGAKIGKSTQELMLKEPDWVQAFLSKVTTGKVVTELKRHKRDLAAKSFTEECHRCDALATRLSYYQGNPRIWYPWCDGCDPYSMGASPGKLTMISTWTQALRFVDNTCKGRREDKRIVVRALAEAKGLPKKVGQAAAMAFLP